MTNKEALLDIQKRNETLKKEGHFHIGTLTMGVIEKLVERDTPVKPIKLKWKNTENYYYVCPKCEEMVARTDEVFCQDCGQRIDWS